jgi:hypothetical protein
MVADAFPSLPTVLFPTRPSLACQLVLNLSLAKVMTTKIPVKRMARCVNGNTREHAEGEV